jgi:uncharacterized iron-regulated protein
MENMKGIVLGISIIACVTSVNAQELEAYRLYDGEGKEVDFGKMSLTLSKSDVILFGELHNDPIGHWLQLELAKSLIESNKLVLGAEWFESDDQVIINEFLNGSATQDHLKKEAKVWPNYDTDYRPIIEFAKDNSIEFIATNIPRRYASLVSKKGQGALDSLSKESKLLLPKMPYTVTKDDEGYESMKAMMGHGHGAGMNIDNMIAAQALKDYTMAENILLNRGKDELFIHYNGSFHSQNFDGISRYLKAKEPKLKVAVIAAVSDDSLDWNDEWKGMGTYILVVPEGMTKTH